MSVDALPLVAGRIYTREEQRQLFAPYRALSSRTLQHSDGRMLSNAQFRAHFGGCIWEAADGLLHGNAAKAFRAL